MTTIVEQSALNYTYLNYAVLIVCNVCAKIMEIFSFKIVAKKIQESATSKKILCYLVYFIKLQLQSISIASPNKNLVVTTITQEEFSRH